MDITEEKLEIIKWLAETDDAEAIEKLILVKRSLEAKRELTPEERAAVEEGMLDYESGNTLTHEEVLRITKERYPQLFGDSK